MDEQHIMIEDSFRTGKSVAVEARVCNVRVTTYSDALNSIDTYISYDDARKLVEMLIKHTHPGHTIEPSKPVTAPQLLLTWKSMRDGLRYAVDVDNEAEATSMATSLKLSNPQTPIRLAQVTKEFVQPNPSYEWKDL